MQTIKKKLRSQYGASITFALLLFLVCAALCSVIIVAATTAAGRMSNLAETDQRYYAVTSAADLVKELLDEPVSIVQRDTNTKTEETTLVTTTTTVTTMERTEDSTDEAPEYREVKHVTIEYEKSTTEEKETESKQYLLNKEAKTISDEDYVSENEVPGDNSLIVKSLANDAAYWVFENKPDKVERTISVSPTEGTPLNGVLLPVEIEESLNPQEGLLVFTIYNSNNSKGTPYTLELSYQASQTESIIPGMAETSTETKNLPTSFSGTGNIAIEEATTVTTVTTTVVNTTIKSFTWELKSVRTISA